MMVRIRGKLRAIPWTPVLLVLLLISTIANYVEGRNLERSLGYLYIAVRQNSGGTSDEDLTEINKTLEHLDETLDRMSDVQDCMAYHRRPCEKQ